MADRKRIGLLLVLIGGFSAYDIFADLGEGAGGPLSEEERDPVHSYDNVMRGCIHSGNTRRELMVYRDSCRGFRLWAGGPNENADGIADNRDDSPYGLR